MLAHAGVGSRRACEDYILQGRISINGKTVRELGTKVVSGRDKVAVDGQPIHDERPAYIAVNKPKGYVSTNNDPSGRPRVVDLIPDIPQRVYTVGRLDEMSTGLMLLTNDGELANRLAHPKFGVEKVYRAVVAGSPPPEVLQKLVEGVWLAEGKVRAKRVKPIAHKGEATVMEMVLAEGKNREVRRMFAKLGHKVMTLTRVAVGPITLKGLKPGGWRFLSSREVDLLQKVAAGLPIPTGRYGNDRPVRPPTRGPQAANRPGGPPLRGPQSERRPYGPPSSYRPGGPAGQAPQGERRPYGPPSRDDRRPPRRDDGPTRPRLADLGHDGPPRFGNQGGVRRPGPPQDGARRPGPRRTDGPRPPMGGVPPRPAQRPPRDEPPARRIIGMEPTPRQDGPETRRPSPRKRPGSGPPRPKGGLRQPPPRKRRPGDDSGE